MKLRARRFAKILKYVDIKKKGIEVAPYYKPIVSKADGDVLIIDVFDTDTLRQRAESDPLIDDTSKIEPVDLVGDASEIERLVTSAGLAGQIHYVVSSHNFEHLPNPIKFLQGCSAILAPDGVISMAVPDNRACFDYFRMPTRLSDWLAAYYEDRNQPSAETLFDAHSLQSMYLKRGKKRRSCTIVRDTPNRFVTNREVSEAFKLYERAKSSKIEYIDAHCSVFFPETMELMISDLIQLGLVDLEIVEISRTEGHEFFVHLRKPQQTSAISADVYYDKREKLLFTISKELGASPYHWSRLVFKPLKLLRRFLSALR